MQKQSIVVLSKISLHPTIPQNEVELLDEWYICKSDRNWKEWLIEDLTCENGREYVNKYQKASILCALKHTQCYLRKDGQIENTYDKFVEGFLAATKLIFPNASPTTTISVSYNNAGLRNWAITDYKCSSVIPGKYHHTSIEKEDIEKIKFIINYIFTEDLQHIIGKIIEYMRVPPVCPIGLITTLWAALETVFRDRKDDGNLSSVENGIITYYKQSMPKEESRRIRNFIKQKIYDRFLIPAKHYKNKKGETYFCTTEDMETFEQYALSSIKNDLFAKADKKKK